MAFEAHDDHTFGGHVDIFYVATVLLQVGAYLCQSVLHFLLDGGFLLVGHVLLGFEV